MVPPSVPPVTLGLPATFGSILPHSAAAYDFESSFATGIVENFGSPFCACRSA